jgi:steroid delta-isomerase-like uncharacterized protein
MDQAERDRREAIVREHMTSENEHRFEDTLATFTHPRYELVATGQVFDGADEVRRYYATSRAAFPDQRNEVHAIHHADDAVIVEFDLLGTNTGELNGRPPTGRAFRTRMAAVFTFDPDRSDGDPDRSDGDPGGSDGDPDRSDGNNGGGIVCERVYYDTNSILRQLSAP